MASEPAFKDLREPATTTVSFQDDSISPKPGLESKPSEVVAADRVDLEKASSSTGSSAALGDMAGAAQGNHYQPKQDIITRMECITDVQMKVAMATQLSSWTFMKQ